MANPFKKEGSDMTPELKTINKDNFFDRYDQKPNFLAWGELSRDEDVDNVSKFIHVTRCGYRFIKVSVKKTDKGGTPYKYLTYLLPNADTDGIKLVLTGPWAKVFEDYQNRLIRVDFTLDELVEEARK